MPITPAYEPKPVPYVSILDASGKVDTKLEPKVAKGDLLRMYETMCLSREFDMRRLRLQRQGRIGTFAPAHGQEACQVGSISQVRDDDWFVPAFRETPCYLWRGADLADDLLYCAGFEEGMNIPEGAPITPICIPIGTQYTHALGVAWAERLKGNDRVAITYGGEGSTSEGDFHEAINMAAVYKAPVVFFIQNNQWAISVPRKKQTKSATIAQKGIAYEVPCVQVDGNDLLAVIHATREAVAHARAGKGPYLVEGVTYRMNVHTTADDPRKYRSAEEEKAWEAKDPIVRMRAYLVSKKLWSDAKEKEMQARIAQRIDDAVERFEARKAGLEKDWRGIFRHAYLENPPYLERQEEELRRHYESVGGPLTEDEIHERGREIQQHLRGA